MIELWDESGDGYVVEADGSFVRKVRRQVPLALVPAEELRVACDHALDAGLGQRAVESLPRRERCRLWFVSSEHAQAFAAAFRHCLGLWPDGSGRQMLFEKAAVRHALKFAGVTRPSDCYRCATDWPRPRCEVRGGPALGGVVEAV